MVTLAAASFGNGSVVMIACAAADPWSAASALMASGSPLRIFSMLRDTPMTPVDATSTCSGAHPTSFAVSAAISRATCRPASPVHAFAHPLLTTIARAIPPDRCRCSFDTSTGAACARFVVKTAAAVAGWSETSRARSSPFALMPALTPAARKPFGRVTPPESVSSVWTAPTLMRAEPR
jgi:hypothetical protein